MVDFSVINSDRNNKFKLELKQANRKALPYNGKKKKKKKRERKRKENTITQHIHIHNVGNNKQI